MRNGNIRILGRHQVQVLNDGPAVKSTSTATNTNTNNNDQSNGRNDTVNPVNKDAADDSKSLPAP